MTVPTPPRWEPDTQLVAAVLSTPKAARRMADLPMPDRAWVVAGLTLAGLTAKDIAERLSCSLRLVRTIRAEDLTQVCLLYQVEAAHFTDEVRLAQSEHLVTRRELDETQRALERTKRQLDNLLDKLVVGEKIETFPRCGHPKVEWNTYRYVDRSGPEPRPRKICRECNRERVAKFRAKRRPPAEQVSNANA